MNTTQQGTPLSDIVFTEKGTFLYKTYIDNKLHSVYADGIGGVYISSDLEIPMAESTDAKLLEHFARVQTQINLDEVPASAPVALLAPSTTEFIFIKLVGDRVRLGGQTTTADMLADGWIEYTGVVPKEPLQPFEYLAMENSKLVIKTNTTAQQAAHIEEMKQYLKDTDYKMTIDYFASLTTDRQQELTSKRETARQVIRETQTKLNTQIVT